MIDQFGREINYIRISVTDRCNLKCDYCVPDGGAACIKDEELLTFDETVRICSQAVKLGINSVKLTGGEPLVRANISDLVRRIKRIDGILQVTMTTNGVLLKDHIDELVSAGLDAVNISIDSVDPERYHSITRVGNLEATLEGLKAAINSGINVKVNSVLYPGNDWKQIIELAKDKPIGVRLIETMPLGMGIDYSGDFLEDVLAYFNSQGIRLDTDYTVHGNGPAIYYKPEGFAGYIGIVAPMHGKFCNSCNRIRLSASGKIKPCLCFGDEYDIGSIVRTGSDEDVLDILKRAIMAKPLEHKFTDRDLITEKKMMSMIGG